MISIILLFLVHLVMIRSRKGSIYVLIVPSYVKACVACVTILIAKAACSVLLVLESVLFLEVVLVDPQLQIVFASS